MGSDGQDKIAGRCEERVRFVKFIFQILGTAVGISFALQGLCIFMGPAWGQQEQPIDDFWEACHWASEGALCVLVGLGAVGFELQACFPHVARHMAKFAANRVGLALVYLWMGCYSCGGRIKQAGTIWKILGQVTGLIAWGVCVGHLFLACCSERQTEEDKERARVRRVVPAPVAAPTSPTDAGSTAATFTPKEPAKVEYANMSGYGIATSTSTSSFNPFAGDDHSEAASHAEPESKESTRQAPAQPAGGWNTFGSKPFGCG